MNSTIRVEWERTDAELLRRSFLTLASYMGAGLLTASVVMTPRRAEAQSCEGELFKLAWGAGLTVAGVAIFFPTLPTGVGAIAGISAIAVGKQTFTRAYSKIKVCKPSLFEELKNVMKTFD